MLHLIVWSLAGFLYYPIFRQLYSIRWQIVDYTHSYFILPAAVLFFAWKFNKFKKAVDLSSSSAFFAVVLLLSVCLFLFGSRHDFLVLTTFSLIPFLVGLVGYLYGPRALQVALFPILYLLFLVPPPVGIVDNLTLGMRYGISKVVAFLLGSFDIPIHREGLLLFLGNQEIFIAAACSGFRSLITFFALATLYIFVVPSSRSMKMILMASIIPLALLGNLVRVIVLCLITYYFGADAGQGFLHSVSGLLVFVIMILGFVAIEALLKAREES